MVGTPRAGADSVSKDGSVGEQRFIAAPRDVIGAVTGPITQWLDRS